MLMPKLERLRCTNFVQTGQRPGVRLSQTEGWIANTMRSSKQRSRSKLNRNRSIGNVVNRVFDSSGPEGKVRGTPQQIIEKYNQLARDAQLGGDRVATENFQQHAEHYTRMLAEAMREQEARREAQEAQHRERQLQRAAKREEQLAVANDQQQRDVSREGNGESQLQSLPTRDNEVIDVVKEAGGLVETPETTPAATTSGGNGPRRRPEPAEGGADKVVAETAQ